MSDFEKALAFSLSTSRSSVQGAVNKYTFDSDTDYLFAHENDAGEILETEVNLRSIIFQSARSQRLPGEAGSFQ